MEVMLGVEGERVMSMDELGELDKELSEWKVLGEEDVC